MNYSKIFLLTFLPMCVFAQSNMIVPDSRKINEFLSRDIANISFQSPLILKNSILFFHKGKAKSVQIAGDFNDWQDNLSMEESRTNLWVLTLKNRIPKGKYRYRLKVDGFWIADPLNPDFEIDKGGQKLSILNIIDEFIPNKILPFWISNNTYLFQYQNTNANLVTIAGDFNDWNPFSHQLNYKGAGVFELELELEAKKIYLYSFVQDGIWIADPNNKKQYRNNLNRPVSAFYADQTNSIP